MFWVQSFLDQSCLFLNIIGLKFAAAIELNDHDSILRGYEMGYAGRNHDKTACRVSFEICGVEFRAPCPDTSFLL